MFESAREVATHQTSHNSGVVHAGLYYRPSSLKATLCRDGHAATLAYCASRNLPLLRAGKLIVALDREELPALKIVHERAKQNGVPGVQWLHNERDIVHIEKACEGSGAVGAVWSPETAVVDWGSIARAFAQDVRDMGGTIHNSTSVCAMQAVHMNSANGIVKERLKLKLKDEEVVAKSFSSFVTDRLISCAGVHADRVAQSLGGARYPRIIPIRGEYFTLSSSSSVSLKLPKTNIYPVPPLTTPDEAPPFLGVHFTPTLTPGIVLVGPNAVPALSRNGYRWSDISVRDVMDTVSHRSFWNLARKHTGFALQQVYRSLIDTRAAVEEARRFVPGVKSHMFERGGVAGVRAQAVSKDGSLIDDFVFETVMDGRVLHVRNAPSPAATSSMAIARAIVDRIQGM